MGLSRRDLLAAVALTWASRAAAQTPAPRAPRPLPAGLSDPAETLDLWPGLLPRDGGPLVETVNERSTDPTYADRAVFGISRPRLAVFRPQTPNGCAVLITPGGGYRWVVVDKEGYEFARWLAARGFTAFVLFYRLPAAGWADRADVPLADAQRAVRVIRSRASGFGINPDRVVAAGFSAGGHVCADLAARFDAAVYAPVDAADRLSARPSAASPMYPVISMNAPYAHAVSREQLLGPAPSPALEAAHSPHLHVGRQAPPHFLLHAEDDRSVPVENTLLLRAALKAQGIPCETHLFPSGGHGFGLRLAVGTSVARWPDLWSAWVDRLGFTRA
jgi:acetyl esterase/lipase